MVLVGEVLVVWVKEGRGKLWFLWGRGGGMGEGT